MHSILLDFYKEPSRPVSQRELSALNKKNLKNLKLGNYETYHDSSGYFYLLKKNGKKETEAIERYNKDPSNYNDKNSSSCSIKNIGTCSVTWKLRNTPAKLRDLAHSIVDEYCRSFKDKPLYKENLYLSHYEVELTRVFYIWLYYENYNDNHDDNRDNHDDNRDDNRDNRDTRNNKVTFDI